MEIVKRNFLPIVVFLTGASVLIVEIVAVRILSPFYGSTLFTVSSVISVILAALSLGYYVGGRQADMNPSRRHFFSIILMSGVTLLLLHLLGMLVLPMVSSIFSLAMGPFVSAIFLFLFPAFLLGMLSPYAIKLQSVAFPDEGIGSVSGKIFFWSTLGSITGSLLAGFVFIPLFGVNEIMLVNAVALFLLGFIPLVRMGLRKEHRAAALLMLVLFSSTVYAMNTYASEHVVYAKDGVYERLLVYESTYKGRPALFFQQDRTSSGAMFLDTDDPTDLVYDYTKYYELYKIFTPEVKNALVIGGGAYSIPKAMLAEWPEAQIDVSEIEPSLLELSQEYFDVPASPRLFNTTEDGRRWLVDSEKRYDVIFSDVYYSLYSIPTHFTTQEFFALTKDSLAEGGIFIANLIGDLSRSDDSILLSEMKTFQTVFPNSYFFAVTNPGHLGAQNVIFVGYNSDVVIDIDTIDSSIAFTNLSGGLKDHAIDTDRYELSKYYTLTDNYAPVERLTATLLRKSVRDNVLLNGEEMLALIEQQVRYGARHLEAPGHAVVQNFILKEMEVLADEVIEQAWTIQDASGKETALKNIIARFNPDVENRIILGTHYDSKKHAHLDDANPYSPVPGANDSASGVAVLLEVSRFLSQISKKPAVGVDVLFFDGEEGETSIGGDFSKWTPLGSTYFADHIEDFYEDILPSQAVILDMVCDKDLEILIEKDSAEYAPKQIQAFWMNAERMGIDVFAKKLGTVIRDDHTPLNAIGIPSFLLIDFTYKPFHTTKDTLDKCSATSLESVARAVSSYVYMVQ